jgi:hypothetical protein
MGLMASMLMPSPFIPYFTVSILSLDGVELSLHFCLISMILPLDACSREVEGQVSIADIDSCIYTRREIIIRTKRCITYKSKSRPCSGPRSTARR